MSLLSTPKWRRNALHRVTGPPRWRAPVETAFVSIAFVAATQPVFLSVGSVYTAILVFLAVCAGFVAQPPWSRFPIGIILFLGWAVLSLAWSADRRGSVYALAGLLAVVLLAYLTAQLGSRRILEGIWYGAVAVAFLSLILAYLAPHIALTSNYYQHGALQGIYPQRNLLGTVLGIGVAAGIGYLVASSGRRRVMSLVFMAVLFVALFRTESATSLAVSTGLFLVAGALLLIRRMTPLARLAFLPLAAALFVSVIALWGQRLVSVFFEAVQRDESLTGRSDIWALVLDVFAAQPVTGYGWGGVWGGPVGAAIQSRFGYDAANSAHNGYLELLLLVGWVGFALYMLVLLAASFRSTRLAIADSAYMWMPLVLIMLMVFNLSQARFGRPVGLFLVVVIATVALAITGGSSGSLPESRRFETGRQNRLRRVDPRSEPLASRLP